MTPSKLKFSPERTWTWEQWQAGRAERRRLGNLVAPKNIRRKKRRAWAEVQQAL
jgi:hypothetical protein